jgi:hypothetical protein
MDAFLPALPWALVIVGGPVLLGLVLVWVKLKSARSADPDPNTPSDDPSKGMQGHD